jgi:hypothetical protein
LNYNQHEDIQYKNQLIYNIKIKTTDTVTHLATINIHQGPSARKKLSTSWTRRGIHMGRSVRARLSTSTYNFFRRRVGPERHNNSINRNCDPPVIGSCRNQQPTTATAERGINRVDPTNPPHPRNRILGVLPGDIESLARGPDLTHQRLNSTSAKPRPPSSPSLRTRRGSTLYKRHVAGSPSSPRLFLLRA